MEKVVSKLQIIDCEQGSEGWFRSRLGVPSASNFSKIVTSKGELSKSLRDYAFDLAGQSLIEDPEEGFKNASMLYGNDMEPEAREAYQQHTFNKVDEVGFMIRDGAGYSSDGLISKTGLVEIKCPQGGDLKVSTHTKYLYDKKLPTKYWQQCQGGLMVSGREWLDFVSFHPNFKGDKKLFIIRVERDEEFIKKLKDGINKVIELRNDFIKKIANIGNE